MSSLSPLPSYPSTQSRKSLSASQNAKLNQVISSSLLDILALPPAKQNTPATRRFISSYVRDGAQQKLQSIIWGATKLSGEDVIRKRVFLLAERLAASSPGLDVRTMLDFAIVYSPTHHTRLRALFSSMSRAVPTLSDSFESEVVLSFAALLRPANSSGLYGLRKTAHCLSCLLHACPIELIRPFSRSKEFILALASAYHEGLAVISRSYGGMRIDLGDSEDADEWKRLWVETKVDIVDSFHILVSTMLQDISTSSGPALAVESERTFGIMSILLEMTPTTSDNHMQAPFLNQSLIADYQHSYDVARTLARIVRQVAREDKRSELLAASLQALGAAPLGGKKNPGALTLLIKSSGIPPGINYSRKSNGTTDRRQDRAIHGSENSSSLPDPDLDLKISQVLDIFPDESPDYVRALLVHPDFPFHGSAEKVIEALLEGNAPAKDRVLEDLEHRASGMSIGGMAATQSEDFVYTKDRRNVFDDEIIDFSAAHKGKKRENEASILRDRNFINEMKADILRRAEIIMNDEDDDDDRHAVTGTHGTSMIDAIADDDPDEGNRVRVLGDGERSGESEGDDDDDDGSEDNDRDHPRPETILELAYIQNPKLFERDANTRRSSARADLKKQTGWTDEQIEGWRIMLERNPKKEKILQKHEFAGNQPMIEAGSSNAPSITRGGGRGRGRGDPSRRRGGRGGGEGSVGGASSERAWKDRNKASRANHNRKRGHDRKMAKSGPAPSN